MLQDPNICKICEYCLDSQNFGLLLKLLLNVFTVQVILSTKKSKSLCKYFNFFWEIIWYHCKYLDLTTIYYTKLTSLYPVSLFSFSFRDLFSFPFVGFSFFPFRDLCYCYLLLRQSIPVYPVDSIFSNGFCSDARGLLKSRDVHFNDAHLQNVRYQKIHHRFFFNTSF